MMKYKLIILLCFISGIVAAQGYNPGNHIPISDAIFPAQKIPLNGRTMYYDASLVAYRDFQNTTEVLTTLAVPAARFGAALICVHQGGTLSGATFTGGIRMLYWFRNGIADSNLVKFPTDTTAIAAAFLIANNLSEGNPITIKTNLGLQNVDNTSDATKWAATATITNKTISGLANTLTNIGNSSLVNSSIGLNLTATGTDVSIPITPASLGNALTINIPTASGSARGVLQSSDFTKFSNKIDSVHVSGDSIYDCIAGTCTLRGFIAGGSGGGITSLNGLVTTSQSFATGTAGSDFNIVSGTSTHTFNFPNASASNRGLLTNTDWTTFNGKQSVIVPSYTIGQYWNGYEQFVALNTDSITEGPTHLFYTNTRARAAISLTTIGSSGAATYTPATGVLNIPNYSGGGGTVTGFNNGLSLSGSIGQLGGTPLLQNTTISARNLYKLTLDSLGFGLYFNKVKPQPTPTSSYKLLLSDTSDNGQVYTGTLSLFDSTGASTFSTPYLFFNTATNTIQVTALPTGPWIKVGNITSTQATTDTVIVGSILFPKGKFNTPGIQNDGAITGKNTVTFGGSDTLQNDTTLITATAAGSFYHKHMVTTVDGGGLGFGFGAHMHKWDWTNANISVNASNYINEFTYRENAANGSTRDFIPNILYAPSVGSGDSLRSAYAFLTQLSNPVGNLGSVGIGHLVGTGNYPNVHGAYAIYDDNFTVGGPHETVHSNLAYGVNNLFLNSTGGAHSILNYTGIDTIKWDRFINVNATGTAFLIGGSPTDSLFGKIILGTNLSMSGNILNATGGGGGSQTLQQTLALGNVANINIVDSNTIQGDSAVYRNGYLTGNVQVGDTILTSGQLQTWFIYGSSGSTDPGLNAAIGYGKATATYLRQLTYIDSAISGTGISHNQGAQALANRIAGLPVYNSITSFLWSVDAGINDAYLTDSVAYKTDLAKIIDTLHINRGWPLSKILIMSPWYCPTRLIDSNFVQVDRGIAATKGVLFLDAWHPFQQAYFSGQPLIYSDSLHPSTLGQFYWAGIISNVIKFGEFQGNLTAYGNIRTRRNLTVDSVTKIAGALFPNGGVYEKANHSYVPFVPVTGLSNGDDFGIDLASNAGQPVLVDTVRFKMNVNTGAQSTLTIGREAAGAFTPWFYANGSNNIGIGTTTLQTGYPLTTSGALYVGAKEYINGSIKVVADNTYDAQRLAFFRQTNSVIAMGVASSNDLQIGNAFGNVDIGQISPGDGTTFQNIRFRVQTNGRILVNTTTDNGVDPFQVSGTIGVTALNIVGDATYRPKYLPLYSGSGNYIGIGLASGTNETQISNAFGPTSFGSTSGSTFTEHSQFNTGSTRLSINTVDDAINALNVSGRAKITDTFKLPNIVRKLLDTTNFKLVVVDASGSHFKTDWPTFGGTGVTTIGSFSNTATANALDISSVTLTAHAADGSNPGMIKGSGSQTIAPILTMPAPLFTSLTSSGANDSVLTVDPSTGQVHRRAGTANFYAANGLQASTVIADSFYLGGTLNQNTTIANAGFGLTISGSGKTNLNSPVTFGQATTTDANYTMGNESQVLLVNITANRTLTLPSASGNTGRIITIANYNTNSFVWTNSLIIDPTGGGVPIGYLVNGATYDVFSDGSGWILKSIHYGGGQQVNQNAVTITSGTASTIGNFLTNVFVDPSSLIATYTLTLPSNPPDGALVKIHFGGTIGGNATVVTSLTISPNSGQSIEQTAAPITAVGGNCFIYQYNIANSKWYREQ